MGFLARIGAVLALVMLAGCAEQVLSARPDANLGEFRLNVNYAFDEKATKVGHTRTAELGQWAAAVSKANRARLGRYSGSQPYDIGVSVESYTLGQAGIPIIYNPRSSVIVFLNVYDPTTKTWLVRGHQMQAFENTDGESLLLGSGGSRTQQEQIDGLAFNLARQIESYLEDQHEAEGWFDPLPPDVLAQSQGQ